MKKALLSLLVLIGLAFGTIEAQNTCFGDWRYILPVTITNLNSDPLQDFQVKITLNTQDLINTGKMNPNGSDIRITSSDCCTPLPYWIQSGINTPTTDIWVRVPGIPAFSATTLTMYYGNTGATSIVSNIDSVMLSLGNDDTGTEVFNGGQSIASRRYAFSTTHKTVRWRIYSSSSADIRFKVVDSAGIVDGVSPVVTTGATPGFYSFDLEILGENNASPGWYSDSTVNFLNNCTPAGPCPGSCGDNVFSNGDTGAGTAPGLQNDTCGFYPSIKVWYRNVEGAAFFDPTTATGVEFDRFGTVIAASANPDSICIGDTTTLSVVPAGAQSYWWYTSSGTYIANGLSVDVTSGGDYYCVADFGSCQTANSSDVTVTVTVPSVDLGPDRVECTDSSYTIDAGAGYTSYLWSNGSTGQTLTVSISGTFWVEVIDSNNCMTSDTVSIQLEPIPSPVINPSGSVMICNGSSITLDAFDPDWFIYSWSPGGETSADIIVSNSGDYYVTVLDSFGCQGTSDTTTISFFPSTQVTLPGDTVICEEDSLVLTVDSSWATILWADSVSDALSYTVYTQGDYWIEVTDNNGCPSRDTMRVDNFDAPVVDLGNDTIICTGESVLLDAGPGFATYIWSDGTDTQTYNAGAGTHFVQVISTDGCEGMSNMLEVTNFPVPAIPVVSYDNSILTTTSGTEYQWYYEGVAIVGATASTYIPTQSGPYYVEVSDDQQCVVLQSNIVDVIIGITQDDIPEGFSPNGDDLNDRFEIVGIDQFPNSQLTVMSRWGEVVFKEAPYQNNFNGTYEGKDLPDGTYFYILDLGLEDDSKPFNGYVIIHR